MPTLQVHLQPEYPVHVFQHWPGQLAASISEMATEAIVVTDDNVAPLYLDSLLEMLQKAGLRAGKAVFRAGENHKNLQSIEGIVRQFSEFHLTRSGVVLALGGGVAGDMAGFAAAIWLRGVPVIQLPTSLLAMVDSSIGGKTGVDLPCGKNLVGAFHQPAAVFAATETLRTLPPHFLRDGAAEMAKAAVLADGSLLQKLAASPEEWIQPENIAECIHIKANIVEQDPQERHLRKLLNLGHTAGHALETLSDYRISHGHAVATGMAIVARAGERAGITSPTCLRILLASLRQMGFETETDFSTELLTAVMAQDKKRSGGNITLVVPREIGDCTLLELPVAELPSFFQASTR